MIYEALWEAGIESDRFAVIPFPIEEPSLLPEFLPTDVPIYTTLYDAWNRKKVEILTSVGYGVNVLWERKSKEHSGAEVRQLIAEGDSAYVQHVPPATVRLVEEIGLTERLRSIAESAKAADR